MKIIKKAWFVDAPTEDQLVYPMGHIVFAETQSKARMEGLKELGGLELESGKSNHENYKGYNYGFFSEVGYLDITARRSKSDDIVLFDGEEIERNRLVDRLKTKKRNDKLEKLKLNNPNAKCIIYAGCYSQYWGENRGGYTTRDNAGIYSIDDAVSIVKSNDINREEEVIIIANANEIDQINKEIAVLESRKNKLI